MPQRSVVTVGTSLLVASLALAEQNMAQGNYREARFQAQRAQKMLPPGAQRQRAQDLLDDAKRAQDNQ